MNKPEILAPAGSYDAFLAAVHNGCDAVYLGGKAYGARAYAKNFDIETLTRATSYAAKFGVKIYYTINTLFKEKEVAGLLDHIEEVLGTGVDALIVQDMGMLSLLKKTFPGVELHVSTQMNCHSLEGLRLLEEMGVSRVVLARELNLDEIKYIGLNSSMELETFVHGALCYCYSGQCLMSSFLGGRSGNRGRCAQPCRLTYKGIIGDDVYEATHLLSPKDIETLSILPDLIDAGIHSLKIEGRMKSPEYVGLMTGLYRKYRDLYLEKGHYQVTKEDIKQMLQVFNRGEFSTGYYHEHNGPDMITFEQPKNQGIRIGKVQSVKGGQVTIQLEQSLVQGDCIELKLDQGEYHSIIVDRNYEGSCRLNIKEKVKSTSEVRRLKSVKLNEILKKKNEAVPKIRIDVHGTFKVGEEAVLRIRGNDEWVDVKGDLVQEAQKQGMSKEKITKQLSKTGDYPVTLDELTIDMDNNIFMAVSQLNALRRKALEVFFDEKAQPSIKRVLMGRKKSVNQPSNKRNVIVLLKKCYQFETVMAYDVKRLYLEWMNFTFQEIESIIHDPRVVNKDIEVYLAMPRILRHEKMTEIKKLFEKLPKGYTGFLLRAMDNYHHVKDLGKKIVWDYSMNVMNQSTVETLMSLDGSEGYMPSLELKFGEMKGLDLSVSELLVYGHVNVMTSAQCVRKSLDGCVKDQGHLLTIEDRKGIDVPVETNCQFCYNNIYNGLPLYLSDKQDDFNRIGLSWFRYDFLNEDKETIDAVLGGKGIKTYTRGHFNKGVE